MKYEGIDEFVLGVLIDILRTGVGLIVIHGIWLKLVQGIG